MCPADLPEGLDDADTLDELDGCVVHPFHAAVVVGHVDAERRHLASVQREAQDQRQHDDHRHDPVDAEEIAEASRSERRWRRSVRAPQWATTWCIAVTSSATPFLYRSGAADREPAERRFAETVRQLPPDIELKIVVGIMGECTGGKRSRRHARRAQLRRPIPRTTPPARSPVQLEAAPAPAKRRRRTGRPTPAAATASIAQATASCQRMGFSNSQRALGAFRAPGTDFSELSAVWEFVISIVIQKGPFAPTVSRRLLSDGAGPPPVVENSRDCGERDAERGRDEEMAGPVFEAVFDAGRNVHEHQNRAQPERGPSGNLAAARTSPGWAAPRAGRSKRQSSRVPNLSAAGTLSPAATRTTVVSKWMAR